MKFSKQARREAKTLFRSCQVDGVLNADRVRRAVQAVIARPPRGHVAMLQYFCRLVKLDLARRAGVVESATALPAALQAGFEQSLNRRYGAGLSLSFAENSALIGGVRIRVGSDVYDASVAGRLAALQESF